MKSPSRTYLFIIVTSLTFLLQFPLQAWGQAVQRPTTIAGWAERLQRFGNAVPQEKVFVHLDNTCYFLGDTIWFAAYTHRTDRNVPSNVSRVLYVELFNQDGYLVERQLIEMIKGRGHGQFVLSDTLYGGYYELRAYTRWQLNWGQTLHPHTKYAEEWFFNRVMAREYYRDYDKLYSRVFPVYDKPKQPGDYYHDMTTRPLRRIYGEDKSQAALKLSLFPEGGQLVSGAECRVAFEACNQAGEWQEGTLELLNGGKAETVTDTHGQACKAVEAVSRGRGAFTFTPSHGAKYEAVFTTKTGQTIKAELKRVADDGVALRVERQGEAYRITVTAKGERSPKELGLTVMHEGRLVSFEEIHGEAPFTTTLSPENLTAGVHQATVFDADGRVWADRLFFVNPTQAAQSTLSVNGVKKQYQPYEQATLEVHCPTVSPSGLSLSVRDAALQDYTYDSGNILTEMLLASEIKGFVPQPGYFFEADDEEHRTALDLLMLTQGWRRFEWQTMAVPGAFAISHPAETQTQMLSGIVHNYTAVNKEDEFTKENDRMTAAWMVEQEQELGANRDALESIAQSWGFSLDELNIKKSDQNATGDSEDSESNQQEEPPTSVDETTKNSRKDIVREGEYRASGRIATSRFFEDEGRLKREVLVHAEFVQPGSTDAVVGDVATTKGRFSLQVPHFYGQCVFYLAASDTTKWKKDKTYQWIVMDEEEFPEFYVRLSFPYPRFVKPYTYYHTLQAPAPEGSVQEPDFMADDATLMKAVTVKARRRGLRAFDASKPAFVLDAYRAFNEAVDAGLSIARYQGRGDFINSIARTYIGDMNMERAYAIEARFNSKNSTFYHSPSVLNAYNLLSNLDKTYIYTDFSPRLEGSSLFDQSNQPTVTIDLRRFADEGQRVTYRDRRYVLDGFSYAEEFYHPNYQLSPPADGAKDYRRTLYWNPDLQFDSEGRATVTFFTGSRPATLEVEANGQAEDGTLITN